MCTLSGATFCTSPVQSSQKKYHIMPVNGLGPTSITTTPPEILPQNIGSVCSRRVGGCTSKHRKCSMVPTLLELSEPTICRYSANSLEQSAKTASTRSPRCTSAAKRTVTSLTHVQGSLLSWATKMFSCKIGDRCGRFLQHGCLD